MPAIGEIRDLLQRAAALRRALNELASKMRDTSNAMTDRGVVPSEDLAQAIVSVHRAFTAVRENAMTAASSVGVQLADDIVDSAAAVERILTAVLEHAEAAERDAEVARAREGALATLRAVALLTHRTEAVSSALAACQAIADRTRAALESATMVDTEAMAPFAALLRLAESSITDDEKWMVAEDAVASAFGRPLAVAASRGRLQLQAGGSK